MMSRVGAEFLQSAGEVFDAVPHFNEDGEVNFELSFSVSCSQDLGDRVGVSQLRTRPIITKSAVWT